MLRAGLGLLACLATTPAAADRAFCNVTPCDRREITRTKLTADEKVGPVTCTKKHEAGKDAEQRIVYCHTATQVVVDDLTIAADAYTLFHPSGKIYQTTVAKPFTRKLADGSTVSCKADLVVLQPNGVLTFCTLGAKRPGSPVALVGESISFHPSGKVAGMTIAETYTAAGITLPPSSSVVFDEQGRLRGGYTSTRVTAGALSIEYDFELYPNGKLKQATLGHAAKVAGHDFPEHAKLAFRDDGTLEAAQYVAKRGFMIHGEPWTDTRHMGFDRAGKITSDRTEHYQSKERPPKFRK